MSSLGARYSFGGSTGQGDSEGAVGYSELEQFAVSRLQDQVGRFSPIGREQSSSQVQIQAETQER